MQLLEVFFLQKMQLLEVSARRKLQLFRSSGGTCGTCRYLSRKVDGSCRWTKKVAQPNTFSMMGKSTNVPRMLPRLVVKKIRKA